MTWHYATKEFYDYAEDIEGVNIHYLWTPVGGVPDWENQRNTRFMPQIQRPVLSGSKGLDDSESAPPPTAVRLRRKILKLPQKILDPQSGTLTDRYMLHHYFEIFQDGHRHYSPLYTEELDTGTDTSVATAHSVDG